MTRGPALAAACIGAAVDVVYLLVIADQGANFAPRVVFIATFIAAMSALSLAGAITIPRDEVVGQSLLAAAATGFLEAGALALASIGIFFILAGLFAAAAAAPRRVSAGVVAAIVVVVTSAFVGGILLT